MIKLVSTLLIPGVLACSEGDAVWTRLAGQYACGSRIEWLISRGKSQASARVQVADEYPSICGSCRDLTCGIVWDEPASDASGDWTCGERISWLEGRGRSAPEAARQVADEFPDLCGPCRPSKEDESDQGLVPPTPSSPPADADATETCDSVWNAPAIDSNGDWTCGERIEYNISRGRSEAEAKLKVAGEVPSVCGPCGEEVDPPSPSSDPSSEPGSVTGFTVVTQNLYWWNLFDKQRGGNFFSMFGRDKPYDIMLFQECKNAFHIRDGLGYRNTHDVYQAQHALAVAWDKRRFERLDRGFREVGEDKPGLWGKRGVAWIRLKDRVAGSTLWIGTHHGPLPINTGGRTGGSAVASNILRLISDTRKNGDAVVLAGDFNADEWSSTVTKLKSAGLQLRESDWVDHVFTESLGEATTKIIRDTGSDHRGIKLTFN